MAKVKQPLLSFDARRKLGDDIVFTRRQGASIVETKPIPRDARSVGQLSWRHMFQKVVALWHALSAAEKEAWESLGRKRHMTGYAWFVSQALRPNPGIYLPLQGGTMTGAIEMNGEHIHGLPAPVHLQDPLRRQDYVDYIQPFLYAHGARVYHSVHQLIAPGVDVALAFDSELYDTDTIHSVVANTSRLTCKTAGKYIIIGQAQFADSGVGDRILRIFGNNSIKIAQIQYGISADTGFRGVVSTIWDLSVNDFVELKAYQSTGGNLNVYSGNFYTPHFMMQRIG